MMATMRVLRWITCQMKAGQIHCHTQFGCVATFASV